jgi:biotin synthase-like enzyme
MFRFANPDRELRIAGGRELHLRSLQPLGLYAANSIFVGDYLTTEGQPAMEDYKMIEDLGFDVTKHEEVATGQALQSGNATPDNATPDNANHATPGEASQEEATEV